MVIGTGTENRKCHEYASGDVGILKVGMERSTGGWGRESISQMDVVAALGIW